MTTPAQPFPIFNQYNYGDSLNAGTFGTLDCNQLNVTGAGTFGGDVSASGVQVLNGISSNTVQCAAMSASTGISTPAFTFSYGAHPNYLLQCQGTSGVADWATISTGITTIVGSSNEIAINGSYTSPQTSASCTFSLPQAVGTSSAVTFGSVTSNSSMSCGTNAMTCGALSSASVTSSGSMSCGTNSMTCGALSSTSLSTGPINTNGSTALVGQLVATGACTMSSLNCGGALSGATMISNGSMSCGTNAMTCGALSSATVTSSGSMSCGTNAMTCGALSSTSVTSSGSMSCSTLATSGAITSANRIVLTTAAQGGVQYPYSANCIGFQWNGSNLEYVIDNNTPATLATAVYSTYTFTAGSSGSPFWNNGWAPNSGSQTFYFVRVGSMVTMSWNTTPAYLADASSVIMSNYSVPAAYIPQRSQGMFVYTSQDPATTYNVGFLNMAANGVIYFNNIYNYGTTASNLVLYGGAIQYSLL